MPVPVLTVAQMREWERATWATGVTERTVIERVGELVAARALDLTAPDDRVLLLAGKGHNGDDVRAAQPHLARRQVQRIEVRDPAAALPELAAALLRRPALVVDGVFGIGLNRALAPEWIALIAALNAGDAQVLSVDVPSGLDADTGRTYGAAVEATVTLAVGAPKAGHLALFASPFVGRLEVLADVGLTACRADGELQWTLASDFDGFPPARRIGAHKGSFGHLLIVAGSRGYHGAAVLAARAAQRAQPGLVTVHTMPDVYTPVAAQLQAVMVNAPAGEILPAQNTTALLVGPGLAAPSARTQLEKWTTQAWTSTDTPVVVDASALDWLPAGSVSTAAARVLTPHPGEAARLLGVRPDEIQRDRPAALRELSQRFGGSWVVLKGHHTLIGRNRGAIFVNGTGNPHLAQGGSGDVLAGYLAGWLAQPESEPDLVRAIRWSVWQHGRAADRLQHESAGWVVEDLVAALGAPHSGI